MYNFIDSPTQSQKADNLVTEIPGQAQPGVTNGDLWSMALESLQGKMRKDVFNARFETSKAQFDGQKLIIQSIDEPNKDWLEHRFNHLIERVVNNLAGRQIEIIYTVQPSQATLPITLEPAYSNDYTEIVKPDVVFQGTQYFRKVWVPILGGARAWLIVELRQNCYKDYKGGKSRSECDITYGHLARSVGVSLITAKRLLRPGPLVNEFILDRKIIRGYSPKLKRKVNLYTRWKIRLDEPIFDPEKHLIF